VPGLHYVIGADIAEAVSDGDFSCAQVLRHDTLEQVAVWHGKTPPLVFADELENLGYWYNTAHITPEFAGIGSVTCMALYDSLLYPNLYVRERLNVLGGKTSPLRPGFVTSGTTKKHILDNLAMLLYDDEITIWDPATIRELQDFEFNYGRSGIAAYAAREGRHDDLVMALALAVEGARQYVVPRDVKDEQAFARQMQETGVLKTISIPQSEDDDPDGEAMLKWCHR